VVLFDLQAKYGYSFQSAAEGTGLDRGSGGLERTNNLDRISGLERTVDLSRAAASPRPRTAVVIESRRSRSEEVGEEVGGEAGRALLQPRPPRHGALLLPLGRHSQETASSDVTDRRTPTIEEEEPELEKLL
jgi:hypothetical protein